jgi:uncharacterized protein YcbX
MKVSGLWIFPVKSCAGIALEKSKIDEYGFEFDRNWVVAQQTTTGWEMVTQRKYPTMVLIQPQIDLSNGTVLILNAPNMSELRVPITTAEPVPITVWSSIVMGISQGREASQWFSKYLGFECELFIKDRSTKRELSEKHTPHQSLFSYQPTTAFADGFPFLILSQESVNEFKKSHPDPEKVSIKTFRANINIQGATPFLEDSFLKINIGSQYFIATARCTRCVMTNNDTETGVPGTDTLKSLQRTRRVDPGAKYEACMGVNLIHCDVGGTISIGDEVTVETTTSHDRRGIWKGRTEPLLY